MYELIPMKKFDFGNLKENVRRKVLKLIKQLVDISRKTPDSNLYLGNKNLVNFNQKNQATIYDRCNKNKYKRNIVKIMHNFDFL